MLFGDSTWESHARPGCQRERSLACQVNGACLLSTCKGPISVAQRARNFFWSIQAGPSAPVKLVVPDPECWTSDPSISDAYLEQERAILSAVKDSHVTVIKGIAEVNANVKTQM